VKKTSPSRQTRQFQETSKTFNTLKALDWKSIVRVQFNPHS
jgi:hypothetical protein